MKKVLAGLLFLITGVAGMSSVALADDLTGSWFVPDQSGFGFLIDQSETDGTVVYWFDYATGFHDIDPGQAWFIASGDMENDLDLYRPSGTWNAGEFDAGEPVGLLSLVYDPLFPNDLVIAYEFYDLGSCHYVMVSPPNPQCSGQFDTTRLTRRE